MRRRLKTFHLLTLAALALSVDACTRARTPARQAALASSQTPVSAPSQVAPSPTPKPVLRNDKRYFKDAIKFDRALHFVDREIKEENEKLKYEIEFTYPQLEGAGDARVRDFNRAVASVVSREVRDFRAWPRGARDERGKRPPHWSDVDDTLNGSYDVAYASDELLSIRYDTYTYGWGAAHSVQQFRVVNYDLAAGRRLQLSHLFRPGAKYLRFIADLCVADLRRQNKADCVQLREERDCESVDSWLPEYVKPVAGNYQNWNLTRGGLLFSFEACLVAGCASGERMVLIPYAELKDLAPAEGIIAQLAQGGNE